MASNADVAFVDLQLDNVKLSRTSSQSTLIDSTSSQALSPSFKCAVCGDDGAKTHYGVLSCLGCKGFFRRALKKLDQYECLNNNKCVINKYERNSCRACRLQKCLAAGMDPAAVRPDRDFTGRQQLPRLPSVSKPKPSTSKSLTTDSKNESWKKLPVEMRTTIMNLLNIETMVTRGDTVKEPGELYPLPINSIREVIEDPSKLKGKRTEMRYEPYRMAKNEELLGVVSRRLVAAIDWILNLSDIMGGLDVEDKICLVKSCFGPLMLLKNAARTAMVTKNTEILCVCNFAYVPRNMTGQYGDTYHLDNGLVARILDEVVTPFRKINVTEEEIVCLCAIICLNPMARGLSEQGMEKVLQLRNRIQDTLYALLKEITEDKIPSSRFGNLLLFIPILTSLSIVVNENIRFAQTFSSLGRIPLLISLFGCFPVEPFLDVEDQPQTICKTVETQTDDIAGPPEPPVPQKRVAKRRLPSSYTNPVETETSNDFRLLQPPCSYTLTEMFDDRINDYSKLSTPQSDNYHTAPPFYANRPPPYQPSYPMNPQPSSSNLLYPPIDQTLQRHDSGIVASDTDLTIYTPENCTSTSMSISNFSNSVQM